MKYCIEIMKNKKKWFLTHILVLHFNYPDETCRNTWT